MIQRSLFRPEPRPSRPAQDRAAAIAWAASVVADPNACFLDTETGGLREGAEICDIAIVAGNGQILLDTLVRPLNPIPAEATAIHHVSEADVAEAPRWSELVADVALLLRGRRVCVYNASYDAGVINGLCKALALPEFAQGWECAMLAFGAYMGEPGKWGKGYRWHRLGDAATHFGIIPGTHRALADAEAARQIVLAMSQENP